MTERINYILKFYKINSSKFADEIGVQKSSISHVLSGRNKPSLDFIQKLLNAFPEINADWLIMGKGKMIIEEYKSNLFSPVKEKKQLRTKIYEEAPENEEARNVQLQKNKTEHQQLTEAPLQNKTGKKTHKIVVFYTDNTFKEFFPEE